MLRWTILGSAVGDPNERWLWLIIVALVLIGVALLATAVWVFRVTRHDPELLAPLDVMGDDDWREADVVERQRTLDEVRVDPDGDAEPAGEEAADDDDTLQIERDPTVDLDDTEVDADEPIDGDDPDPTPDGREPA